MTITTSPVYCKDCGSRNSWQRQPTQDIRGESGRLMWERWACGICGYSTIISALQTMSMDRADKVSRS